MVRSVFFMLPNGDGEDLPNDKNENLTFGASLDT